MDYYDTIYFLFTMLGYGFLSGLIWSVVFHWPKWK